MKDSTKGSDAGLPGANSQELFSRAQQVFPGGITRATVERNPTPCYVSKGAGAYLTDVDGRQFLDLSNNFTTLIHGHGFPPVIEAVSRILRDGTCFSNPADHEISLAALLISRIPAIEKIRFMNTGTEAVMFAIKAARAFTGRPGVAKFEGAYHGAYDWAEVGQVGNPTTWGDPEAPVAVPNYEGMPASVTEDSLILRFNDPDHARHKIAAEADRLACVLLDPMPSCGGLSPPDPEFITAVVETAREHGVLIICDEVLNLRQGYQGASARYGIEPDLITAGKIIGGGFPVGAVGGSDRVMSVFDGSSGGAKVVQAGTFSANPVSMVAGAACMAAMDEAAFSRLERMGDWLRSSLSAVIDKHQADYVVSGAASLFRVHNKSILPRNYREAYSTPDEEKNLSEMKRNFFSKGIILPTGRTACLSTAMTNTDLEMVVEVFEQFLEAG